MVVPEYSYRELRRDFGRQILAWRTRAGLTQAELAGEIGVHRRSLQNWESGESYPKRETLQRLIETLLAHRVFTRGNEQAEALTFWQLAVTDGALALGPFDGQWFARALAVNGVASLPSHAPKRRALIDWGEVIATPPLLGRAVELATLQQWLGEEKCRLVAILGLGGIGKSSLAVTVAQRVLDEFDFVIFHSLQNGPSLAHLLDQTIRAISDQQTRLPESLLDKIALLVQYFRRHRCLLILDNFETLLQPAALAGTYRPGYADYGTLLQWLGGRDHQSCLLLTSREKPIEIGPLEGHGAPARTLQLGGLDAQSCRTILEAKEVTASATDLQSLARIYVGNPLALNLVAEPISELFGGDVAAFLATGVAYFNGVGDLLEQQFVRLTLLEQSIMRWLAIVREPVAVTTLLATLGKGATRSEILAALESLHRRMQIERVVDRPAFTLQPMILEYVTTHLAERIYKEVLAGTPELLQRHMLVQATAKEYVRYTQEQLIMMPLLERLTQAYGDRAALAQQLISLLDSWRDQPVARQQYGPGNVVNLLRLLRGHLRDLNLVGLVIQQGYFRGVEAQDSNLTNVALQECVFTEFFGALTALAVDSSGQKWATSSRRGEVLIGQSNGTPARQTLHRVWQAHVGMIPTLAFSPDGCMLATSGGWEGNLKVWDVSQGALFWLGQHASHVNTVTFAPNGKYLASSSDDATVRLWDASSGAQLARWDHPAAVAGLAWSADSSFLAAGSADGTIHLWTIDTNAGVYTQQSFAAHQTRIDSLAFSPDNHHLASASWDGTVKLWSVTAPFAATSNVRPLHIFAGHTDRAVRLAWNGTGDLLASSSHDPTIWLWDIVAGAHQSFDGHRDGVYGIAFTPDGRTLLSSSEDGTLRVWDVANGECVEVMQGYANSLYAVDWHPNGEQIVSGGTDRAVAIHHRDPRTPPLCLNPHPDTALGVVLSVGWSSDGRWIASSEWDNLIRLWDARTGDLVHLLRCDQDHNPTGDADATNYFSALAWSGNGRLACGSYRRGLFVWQAETQRQQWLDHQTPTWIRAVAWHAQSRFVAGGDELGAVYVWQASDDDDYILLHRLAAHDSEVLSLAWEPSQFAGGMRLVSGGLGQAGGELLVWDGVRGTLLHRFVGHSATVCSVAWGANPNELISGDSEGMLRWWNLPRGEIVRVQKAHQGVIQSLARSPDGTTVASCGDDGAILIWNLSSGDYLQTVRRDRPYERMRIDGLEGITPSLRASLIALGAVAM